MFDDSLVFDLYAIQPGRNDEGNWERIKTQLLPGRVVCKIEAIASLASLELRFENIIRGRMWMPPPLRMTWVDEDTCDVTDGSDNRPLYTFKKLTPGPIETFFFRC